MPFFYKSNLTNDSIFFLNPPENVLDLVKNEADFCENNNREKKNEADSCENNNESNLDCASFPYKDTIQKLYTLLKIEYMLFILFLAYIFLVSMNDIRFDYEKMEIFFESCDARNVIPLNEVIVIDDQIDKFSAEKDIVNVMLGYNISAYTNDSLNQRLANLSNSINGFKKQIEEQKEIRFICFKKNFVKRCGDLFLLKIYENYSTVFYFYLSILVINFSFTYYYILKARKMGLLSKQESYLYFREEGLYHIIVFNIIYTSLFTLVCWIFVRWNAEEDLKNVKLEIM